MEAADPQSAEEVAAVVSWIRLYLSAECIHDQCPTLAHCLAHLSLTDKRLPGTDNQLPVLSPAENTAAVMEPFQPKPEPVAKEP